MWFWWLMLAFGLMVPAIQIGAGWMMWKHCPGNVNNVLGYRTKWSRKNQDTWEFAHEHCGRVWCKVGLVMLAVSLLVLIPFYGADEDTVGNVCVILMYAQMAVLIGSVFPTEAALKRTFNEDGTRK